MLTIGFIGAGITGNALAITLDRQGYHITAVASRSLTSAHRLADSVNNCQVYGNPQQVADAAQLVFITTPDDVIAEVASKIQWRKEQYIVHCSGAHSVDIIQSAREFGASTGCLHPLQTFASVEQAVENLPAPLPGPSGPGPMAGVHRAPADNAENNIVAFLHQKVPEARHSTRRNGLKGPFRENKSPLSHR